MVIQDDEHLVMQVTNDAALGCMPETTLESCKDVAVRFLLQREFGSFCKNVALTLYESKEMRIEPSFRVFASQFLDILQLESFLSPATVGP